MDVDVILEWMLRIRTGIDHAMEAGDSPDGDAVYTLLGLLESLDDLLSRGSRLPRRWTPSVQREIKHFLVSLRLDTLPSNDTSVRRTRVRSRRSVRSEHQLALPLDSSITAS